MSKLIPLVLLCCLIIGCDNETKQEKQKRFTNVDLSYSDGVTSFFSIKFTPGDKVFVKDHFSQLASEIQMSDESYYSFTTHNDRIKLDSFINQMKFLSFEDSYYQPTTNIQYQLLIEKDLKKKLIYIHSDSTPSQLNFLCKWIVALKNNLKLIPVDSTLQFGSLVDFLPPVNRPSINIIDPKL